MKNIRGYLLKLAGHQMELSSISKTDCGIKFKDE
jgi:hypothetical protein